MNSIANIFRWRTGFDDAAKVSNMLRKFGVFKRLNSSENDCQQVNDNLITNNMEEIRKTLMSGEGNKLTKMSYKFALEVEK